MGSGGSEATSKYVTEHGVANGGRPMTAIVVMLVATVSLGLAACGSQDEQSGPRAATRGPDALAKEVKKKTQEPLEKARAYAGQHSEKIEARLKKELE